MGMQCAICGKKPVLGNQYARRGKAYLRQGEAFFAAPSRRRALYTGKGGLGAQHDEIICSKQ